MRSLQQHEDDGDEDHQCVAEDIAQTAENLPDESRDPFQVEGGGRRDVRRGRGQGIATHVGSDRRLGRNGNGRRIAERLRGVQLAPRTAKFWDVDSILK